MIRLNAHHYKSDLITEEMLFCHWKDERNQTGLKLSDEIIDIIK